MNIVIVGAGEVGRYLAGSLSNQQHNISLIERSEPLAAELDEQFDIQIVCGSGSSITTLAEANAAEADLFLALTSDDNTNLVAASMAKAVGAKKTIARVHTGVQREEWLFDFKAHFGIDYIFSSERLAAVELAKYVRNPERLLVEEFARGRIELQQTVVSPESKAAHRKIIELALPPRVRIAAIQRHGENIIPTAQHTIEPADVITLFGEPRKLAELLPLFHPEGGAEREENIVIFGGGEYGFALAQMLEGHRYKVRVIEKNPKLCRDISNLLQRTIVINADATSLQQLREEQVGQADFFISATTDDEDNVMACLQARNLGTTYCLTLVHRADYADVISLNSERLGILGAVSPRVATSRDLLRFVTSDRFHVVMQLPGGSEVLESTIHKNSELAGRKVGEIKWPEGTGLVAVIHGQEAYVPAGEDVVQAGDTVYAIVGPGLRKEFVRLFS